MLSKSLAFTDQAEDAAEAFLVSFHYVDQQLLKLEALQPSSQQDISAIQTEAKIRVEDALQFLVAKNEALQVYEIIR